MDEPDRERHGEDLVDERQADLRIEEPDLLIQHIHRDDEEELGQGIGQQQPEAQPATCPDTEAHDGVGRGSRDEDGERDAQGHHHHAVEERRCEVALAPDLEVLAEVGDIEEVGRGS